MLRVTMADTTQLLLLASMIGAIDVFWFHLWKLRLYRQPSSAAEEVIHLASYANWIAITGVLLAADSPHDVRGLVLGLFALHLIITAADVLLERSSRAPLGGLPSVEYLLHVLVTFGIGGAAATFWWASSTQVGGALEGLDQARVVGSIVFTAVLLAVEGTLLARAVLVRRDPSRSAPHPELGPRMLGIRSEAVSQP